MKSIKFWTLLALLTMGLPALGQEIVSISLAEVQERVEASNTTLEISEQAEKIAQADYKQTDAVFLPQIRLSHTGMSTNNPLMAFGARLNQAILTPNDFNTDLLNNPDRVQNFATRLELQQPIFNPDGVLQRKAARTKMDAVALQSSRTHHYLAFEAKSAYMQLQLAYKAVDVLEQALAAALANQQLAVNSYDQGYLQKADVLVVEVRVTEVQNQLQMAQSQVHNASDYLAFLMNDDKAVAYQPADSLVVQVQGSKQNSVPVNRADIKAMALATEAHEHLLKASKSAYLPRLNAFGSYELYDDGIFQGAADGYVIGASLSWDLFRGNERVAKVQKSQAELNEARLAYEQYLSKSRLEFNKAKRHLQDAQNKLRLTEQAMAQSQESLRIRTNRFKEGLEKTADLLMAESQYAQKRLEYFQTVFEHNHAQAFLHYLTREQ